MFRIADGRDSFYQWDIDRQIIVEDSTITEVHFCNRTDECSLVVEVVNGLANVPNVILQKSFDFRVFGYDGKATRYDDTFKVKARTKPTDYVYTEVEIKRYEDLNKRIDEIEKNGVSEEVITNAVEDYLDRNPVDLTGYATEEYVDNAISNIPEVDLSKHALKSEIPTKISQLENDSKFITRDEVPNPDLSEYITESDLEAKGYVTSIEADAIIAQAQEAATRAAGEASLASDAAYAASNFANYAYECSEEAKLQAENAAKAVEEAIADLEIPEGDSEAYSLVLPAVNGSITDEKTLEILNKILEAKTLPLCAYRQFLITEFAVTQGPNETLLHLVAVQQLEVSTGNYYTQYNIRLSYKNNSWSVSKLNTTNRKYVSKTSDIENDSDFTTKAYVDEAIANIEVSGGDVDLSNYYTKEETNTAIQNALSGIATAEGGSY